MSLPIPENQEAPNPWLEFGGIFKGDSDFAEIVETLQAKRAENE
ncbi:MAG: hypothetical protein AAFN12_03615 [Cyanobacteria bacterium J06560_2]